MAREPADIGDAARELAVVIAARADFTKLLLALARSRLRLRPQSND